MGNCIAIFGPTIATSHQPIWHQNGSGMELLGLADPGLAEQRITVNWSVIGDNLFAM